jgi:hypothetical protein
MLENYAYICSGLEISTVAMAMVQIRKHKYGDDGFTIYC